jgi:hypothetical protein
MFSIDAMLSIGLILIAATTLWMTATEINYGKTITLEILNSEMISFYFNEPQKENLLQTNQKCVDLYYYDSEATKLTFEQTVNQKKICGGSE